MAVGNGGVSTTGLRSDLRQWLIYDDETVGAVMRGLETMALQMTGLTLSRSKVSAVKAMGHFMVRVSSHRVAEMLESDGPQRHAMMALAKVMSWIADPSLEAPLVELDELHAAVWRLDSKANSAGVRGPGTIREAVRGD